MSPLLFYSANRLRNGSDWGLEFTSSGPTRGWWNFLDSNEMERIAIAAGGVGGFQFARKPVAYRGGASVFARTAGRQVRQILESFEGWIQHRSSGNVSHILRS